MTKYILVRTLWIVIIISIILTLNFTLLKLAPEFPPTTKEEKTIYYARQVSDGYMTERVENQPLVVASILRNEIVTPRNVYFKDEAGRYRVYEPISIARQYISWVSNIVTDWNWGYSTRVQVNVPVFEVLKQRNSMYSKL